jgi:hypothetical protein
MALVSPAIATTATAAAIATATPAIATAGTATATPATAVAAAAAATAATAAVATTTTTAAAAAAATLTGGGLVDADHAAHPLHILEVVDGLLLGGVIGEFNEGESAFAAGFPVEGETALTDFAVLAEEIEKVLAFGLEREVADVDGH